MEYVVLLILGSITGLLSGFLGVGGGIIVVPFMLYYLNGVIESDIIFLAVTAISISVAFFSAVFATRRHVRNDNLYRKPVLPLAIGAILGTLPGSYLSVIVPGMYFKLLFSFILIYVSATFLFTKERENGDGNPNFNSVKLFSSGVLVGMFSTVTGLGGGFVIVPLLNKVFNFSLKKATGTSSFLMVFYTLPALFGRIYNGWGVEITDYYSLGYFIPFFAIPIIVGTVLFAPLGAQLNFKMDRHLFRKIAGGLFFIIACEMFISTVF